jgi:hypothetical protein
MNLKANVVAENEPHVQEGGYRFRLRDMLAFVTLCGLQFAIINWIGPMFGVLVGLGIAMIIFTAVFLRQLASGIGEVAAYRDGRTAEPPVFRKTEQRKLVLLALAAYFMAAAALVTGGGIVISTFVSDWLVRREMANRCGFSYRVLSVQDSKGKWVELVDINSVTPDGAFRQAGIRKGDVIYTEDMGKFFRETLYANRGKTVTLDVRKWTTNTTIDQAPSTDRVVNVPP